MKRDSVFFNAILDQLILISIIILQIAMFQEFSPESNSGIANVLTSTGMSAIILTLGILMIIKANKTIKEINETNETKE